MILPEVANSISDEMLAISQSGRNTRIYTETQTYHLHGYPHIGKAWGRKKACHSITIHRLNSVLTEMRAYTLQQTGIRISLISSYVPIIDNLQYLLHFLFVNSSVAYFATVSVSRP